MNTVSKPERATQDRVLELFQNKLGYRFFGDWTHRNNSNVEPEILSEWLKKQGYTDDEANQAVSILCREAGNVAGGLIKTNQAVYQLLRYGIAVQTAAGERKKTVKVIDWANPENNDFAVAEEVTITGKSERRPDTVIYINGIAISVLELKNSRVSVGEGIRQSLSNQQEEYNAWFFSTVQLIFAGNDSEGLRYGTVGTPEKYFLRWKEDEEENSGYKLDKYLEKMCRKDRLIELVYDFILFDGGVKKVPRVHQYFAVKSAQKRVKKKQGGVIWHTQGSGKSIVMVLLARWIVENFPEARVALVTDRIELDFQLESVFRNSGIEIARARSAKELAQLLAKPGVRIICSLIHKFGRGQSGGADYIKGIEDLASHSSQNLFVFVDECHRTNSGKLHLAMKKMLPDATFIGFSGTPLLKQDKKTSREVFGSYIHTYKFGEGVKDEVILDLLYEARDIDQRLVDGGKVDEWFAKSTDNLNEWRRAELKKKWGTMQNVLSSSSRMGRIVSDIIFDFIKMPRLDNGTGNAMLVASSIHEACRYYELFQKTGLKNKSALVTSYDPTSNSVTTEETGASTETDRQFIHNTYKELLGRAGKDAKGYEEWAKAVFVKEPANMKLIIVVDKLLTGFDAPACTYIYLDKVMQDHALFQAICRANRLDGESKKHGYIIDYRDLFAKLEKTVRVYASDLDSEDDEDSQILIKDRWETGKESLDDALEAFRLLCEPVQPPKEESEYIRHFCGNTESAGDLKEHSPRREALYKTVASLLRAYSAVADDLPRLGYSDEEISRIGKEIKHSTDLRGVIRRAADETLDAKAYEADMRYLIDTYIETSPTRVISPFGDTPMLELITKIGIGQAVAEGLQPIKNNKVAVAETIENNIRSKIVKEQLHDPAFYGRMSDLLDELIRERKEKALAYEEYMKKIAELVNLINDGFDKDLPEVLKTSPALRSLYNNIKSSKRIEGDHQQIAISLDQAIRANAHAGWRGVPAKENAIKKAMYEVILDTEEVERLYPIVKQHQEY